ncbi:MAG TPA: hypothetical protein VFP84_16215 [Kofleriaceae bacterium]|nr:hypothetical protein [Kofleriaceae bacterium]
MLEDFRQLRDNELVVAPFASAVSLLECLKQRSQDLDETDRIYAALIRAVQGSSRTAQVAHTLLLCGLWPGLDRFYRRRVAQFRDAPAELAATISGVFTLLVARIDLSGVQRIAATLVRNTRREVTAALRREHEVPAARVSDSFDLHVEHSEVARLFHVQREAESPDIEARAGPTYNVPVLLDLLPDLQSTDEAFRLELMRLHRVLYRLLRADAELILRVLVLEEVQEQVAARLQITPGAARKRFQRAISRLRAQLEPP